LDDTSHLDQLDRHLASPNISWLLGAGISFSANIPLMYPLTERVLAIISNDRGKPLELVDSLKAELSDKSHIEHLLSHLGDYTALAERSKTGRVMVSGNEFTREELSATHATIVNAIAETVRWGLVPPKNGSPQRVGKESDSLVDITEHSRFVRSCLLTARAGLSERRGPLRLFTTNYDTLLEDALALSCVRYWDGFEGGAVAFRAHRLGSPDPPNNIDAHVVKLHGSIDWLLGKDDGRVWRVRTGDKYPANGRTALIYPQSTKYLAAQRDPFSAQFALFRRALTNSADNVLAVCGYSFGDDHINDEVELSMSQQDSRTTLIAFAREEQNDNGSRLPSALENWRRSSWGERVYIATNKGLYVGGNGPYRQPTSIDLDWWTFQGVSRLLENGAGSFWS